MRALSCTWKKKKTKKENQQICGWNRVLSINATSIFHRITSIRRTIFRYTTMVLPSYTRWNGGGYDQLSTAKSNKNLEPIICVSLKNYSKQWCAWNEQLTRNNIFGSWLWIGQMKMGKVMDGTKSNMRMWTDLVGYLSS